MKNIPQKIYLQIGQGNEDEPDFSAFSEVTWSAERVFSNDIEFVLQQPPVSGSLPLVDKEIELDKLAGEIGEMSDEDFANHCSDLIKKFGGNDR